jgi:gamma-glutamyl-gamma-aminobutyrate hydrolase PuuD
MVAPVSTLRIGIYGTDETALRSSRHAVLWPAGYAAAVSTLGATPVSIGESLPGRSWDDALHGIHGLIWTGTPDTYEQFGLNASLCRHCRKHGLPLLAVDHGLHALNVAHGGTLHFDLTRERPEALQHRHRPEPGLRHALSITPGTRLAQLYGDGEQAVNSEHRRAIDRVGQGFGISARALDGIIEAVETDDPQWFAIGVQWRPASASASGLDIQLFRGLVDAARQQVKSRRRRSRLVRTSAA